MTQTDAILAALREGRSLTPLVALSEFGCNRLAARVYDLRDRLEPGEVIVNDWLTTRNGARVASYRLVREPMQGGFGL